MILNVGYVVVVSLKHGVAVSRTFAIDRGKRPAAFIIAVAGLVLVGITMIAASTLLIRLSLQNEPVV